MNPQQEKSSESIRVLWIAPNLNDYKAKFLNVLAEEPEIDLTVIAGSRMSTTGHRYEAADHLFQRMDVSVSKSRFGYSPKAFKAIFKTLRAENSDVVLMPMEKKHLPLIVALAALRLTMKFRLVSYNHASIRSKRPQVTRGDLRFTRFFFHLYDHIIFYTEGAMKWAVEQGLIRQSKASFANNTLDAESIWEQHSFRLNRSSPCKLLFIGRLIPSKRPDLLLEYFSELSGRIPNIQLEIIGDGPQSALVENRASQDARITWHGAIVDESKISKLMDQAHAVFVPGDSGLSIVHAFCYGKPYITLDIPTAIHGPELEYIQHKVNGLILSGPMESNVQQMADFLLDGPAYEDYCRHALETSKSLSVQNWKTQVVDALQRSLDVVGQTAALQER